MSSNNPSEDNFIRRFESDVDSLGAEDSIYFEPLLLEYISHFTSLMEAYQAYEEENEPK